MTHNFRYTFYITKQKHLTKFILYNLWGFPISFIKTYQTVNEGRNNDINSLEDLMSSSVLCGIVNSFVPGTFPTEILLNDRFVFVGTYCEFFFIYCSALQWAVKLFYSFSFITSLNHLKEQKVTKFCCLTDRHLDKKYIFSTKFN